MYRENSAVVVPIALVPHGITLHRLRNWYQYKHTGNFQRLDASMQIRMKDYYKVLALSSLLSLCIKKRMQRAEIGRLEEGVSNNRGN